MVTKIRMLTATDLHQSRGRFERLSKAVDTYRPEVLGLVGDVLDAFPSNPKWQLTTAETAKFVAWLPVKEIVFVRGNHEDSNWTEFVAAWPHDLRPLHGLYGTAYTVGPLTMVGFPCYTGREFAWCSHHSADDNTMTLVPPYPSSELGVDQQQWLPKLIRRLGPAARTIWLMHEPPVNLSIGKPETVNHIWTAAVERFSPHLVICGHDHLSPIVNERWHVRMGSSLCINVGQPKKDFHFVVTDFEFSTRSPSLPMKIHVRAFPRREGITL